VLSPGMLGTGTPSAGQYVDGGTGAWTLLPVAFRVTGVNMTAVAVTNIFTVPTGKTFMLFDAWVYASLVTTLTVGAQADIIESGASGVMGGLLSSTGNLVTTGKMFPLVRSSTTNPGVVCAAGNRVQLNVGTGATAAAFTADITVVGILY
jgi:hypothetical protein